MWFKNLYLFRLTKPFKHKPETLEDKLAPQAFKPCSSLEMQTAGWYPPLGHGAQQLVHTTNGNMMLCMKQQQKVLPASAVKDVLEEKIAEIQTKEGRPVRRKERTDLKDDIIQTLLPRALTRSSLVYGYISPADNLIFVNTSAAKTAEAFAALLRESLGTLSAVPITVKHSPSDKMTLWLEQGQRPKGFELGGDCELKDPLDSGSAVRYKQHALGSKEIRQQIQAGMRVTQLELVWQKGIEFVVDESLSIKRVRFDDVIQEKAQASDADDLAEQFDNDFAMMALELSGFCAGLIKAFGGENLE